MKNVGISSFSVAAHLENSDPWGSPRNVHLPRRDVVKGGKKIPSVLMFFLMDSKSPHTGDERKRPSLGQAEYSFF